MLSVTLDSRLHVGFVLICTENQAAILKRLLENRYLQAEVKILTERTWTVTANDFTKAAS